MKTVQQPHNQIISSTGWQQSGAPKANDYANRVEVFRNTYDVMLRFYRDRGESGVMVKEITIPTGAFDALKES